MDDIYENIDEYNSNKKIEILIIFRDMIADLLSSKKTNLIVAELFITARKLNISLVFITQSYFAVPKTIRLNTRHYSIMKIPSKQELQQILLIIGLILTFLIFIEYVSQNHILS